MDCEKIKEQLAILDERIKERERETKEDRAIISYLQGYVSGIEFFRKQMQ